jgi:insertion element IS1 protein InsB
VELGRGQKEGTVALACDRSSHRESTGLGGGSRKDALFLKLRALLAPFDLTRYYTDKAGVYQRYLPPDQHRVGKLTMQKIERKHLTWRARLKRLARQTLCFSRSRAMHDLLIGLYMNRVEFGCTV